MQILQAWYGGPGNSSADVTSTVQTLAAQGSFTVSNDTMGQDPDPGVQKSLGVVYWDGASLHSLTAPESQTVTFPTAAVTPNSVISAVYGIGIDGKQNDVTAGARGLLSQHAAFTVSNDTFGPDPASGTVKGFFMVYTDASGNVQYANAVENEQVTVFQAS